AVLWWSLFTVLTPPAALASLPLLVAARIALGLGEAAVFPASLNMISRWVPPVQRSRAVTLLTSTLSIATVFALPVTGWIVRGYGWPVPFYAFGAVGLLWAGAWCTRVSGGWGTEVPAPRAQATIPMGQATSL